jgi:transcriptional regulator with XRE-family HTH domain
MRGDRLKELRLGKEMSQQTLADMLGCRVSLVSMYENEIKNPSQDKIIRLAEIFGVATDYLLGNFVVGNIVVEPISYGKKIGLTDDEIKEALDFAAKMKKKR